MVGAGHRADGPPPPRRDWLVRLTPAGRQAQQVWRPLAGEIEERWRDRLGAVEFGRLRAGLGAVAGRAGAGFPPYLPVSGVYPADPAVLDAGARAAAGLRPLARPRGQPRAQRPREPSPAAAAPGTSPGNAPGTSPGGSPGTSPGASPTGKAGSSPRGKAGVSPPVRPGTSPAGNAGGRPAGDRGAGPAGNPGIGPLGGTGAAAGGMPAAAPGTRPDGGPGLVTPGSARPRGARPARPAVGGPAVLAPRVEQETGLTLPVSANVLRVLTSEPRRLRDLPPWPGYPRKRSRCRSACWSAAATR